MTAYHLNPNDGTPHGCGKPHDCPWAAPEEHYPNADLARGAYERMMQSFVWVRHHKRTGRPFAKEILRPVR